MLYFLCIAAMMGAIFAGTTSTIGSMTGQDGKLNYFIGGCAAGSVLGARSKSFESLSLQTIHDLKWTVLCYSTKKTTYSIINSI